MNGDNSINGGIRVNLQSPIAAPTGAFIADSALSPIPNDNPEQIKTLDDLALSDIRLDGFPVVKSWREKLFSPEGLPEICDELPRLLTEYMRSSEKAGLSPYTRRSQAVRYLFTNKTPLVRTTDLLPGQTTTSFVGPVVYADTIGYCIWPELKTVENRPQNPFKIRPEVAERLNKEIFPYWLNNRLVVQEVARYSDYDTATYQDENRDRVNDGLLADGSPSIDPPLKKKAGETPKCQELFERVAFFLSDKATCVSHTVPDFERVLKFGFDGLIKQMQEDLDQGIASTPESREFLQGLITVYEGAKVYALRLAEAAEKAANPELAAICRKIPAQPAETLHEAIACMWICYHLILQENTNFGFSIGRFDQLLNPYYLADWAKLRTDQEKHDYIERAVELVCHFFLRCSDHVPLSTEGSEVLFAGSGSNQALTLGGTRYENGKTVDAVNDMTYITLKATELLAIRDPNVHVRYHKEIHHVDSLGNPLPADKHDPYLLRISQVNIQTRATPAIHGDAPVIQSMGNYYAQHSGIDPEEAKSDAHEYASIGCIEHNSAHRHYGNTGSTLFVLPSVLELSLFGGKHRSLGVGEDGPNLFSDKAEYTTAPLINMKSMDEFIAAFKFQLDAMARHTVQCNNYLGRSLEKMRASPFLSGIFTGPTTTPGTSEEASYRDVAAGGAKYNSAGVAIIGLADVIDSFCVVDSLIFNGDVTASELLAAMGADFNPSLEDDDDEQNWLERIIGFFQLPEGEKPEQMSLERLKEIIRKIKLAPKYGAGVDQTEGGKYNNALAVKYTHLLTEMIQEVFYKYRTHRGGRYLAGYWSMTNHAGFGMLTKATPNGRRDSRAFASGITPCPGIVKANGEKVQALDHILSVAEVNGDTIQNGYTYNLSLTTRNTSHFQEDTSLFARYMKVFLDNDGVLVQLCVSSIEDLKAADQAATRANRTGATAEDYAALEPYKDLMIRVAGYSAYYVTMSPEMRREIIERANFALEDGKEQHALVSI